MSVPTSLTTHTDPGLVVLSVTIAIVASYLALDLTRRSADAQGWPRRAWIAGAGVTMGAGIWSMHFVGMLALATNMPVSYNSALVAVSLVVAVLGASVSLAMVTRPQVSRLGLLSAAAFMGFAVAAMHYLGMASMQMSATIHWHVALVILSVAVGLLSSWVALSLLVRIRQSSDGFGFARRAAAAGLLGVGVAGLHYTAMRASSFTAAMHNHVAGHGFSTGSLVVLLVLASAVMFVVLVGGAAVDQRRAASASDIEIAANIARDLCRVGDFRARMCQAVQQLTGADYVALLEPDASGRHQVTAGSGTPPAERANGVGETAWATPRPSPTAGDGRAAMPQAPSDPAQTPGDLQPTPSDTGQTLAEMIQLSDGESTVRCENLALDGRHVGLLAVVWNVPAQRLSERTETLLGMVAAEAAVAIDRGNLLSRLEYLSRRDELTGLLNRRVFNEELERELLTAVRHSRPLCLVMLDLDHFKVYNDTHGHPAGDRLIQRAAAAWTKELRSTDLIARYGGEEFIVILPDCDVDGAVCIADRLRRAMPAGATCSAGVAGLRRFDTAGRLVDRTDRALYQAKAAGRDQTVACATHSSSQDLIS